jgi:hypothetical protein
MAEGKGSAEPRPFFFLACSQVGAAGRRDLGRFGVYDTLWLMASPPPLWGHTDKLISTCSGGFAFEGQAGFLWIFWPKVVEVIPLVP